MSNFQEDKFSNFVTAFGATRLLLQRANEQGFLIEGLVLYSSLVDGFCRICLILKEQIDKNTSDINERYIYQEDDDKLNLINERNIFKKVLNEGIISEELFRELNILYDVRNKIIHRFFISEIEYSHLEVVCNRYEKVYYELKEITYNLEAEQINKKVGMTVDGPKIDKIEEVKIYSDIKNKIKSGSERNLAKTLNCISVEEVIKLFSQNKDNRSNFDEEN